MRSARMRVVFDLLLTAVLVFEMLCQLTGTFLHEVVGIAFLACIVVHVSLSARWIKETVKAFGTSSLAKRQRVLALVAALLA